MNVPVTIARNKLAASIAASIASNKVLDQENLGERIANILTVGNMVPSEMIEQHRRLYPDVKLPSIDEIDEVLAEFLSNMIVVWEDKEGTIVFSLSEPVRVLSLEYRKNMGAKTVVDPEPAKEATVTPPTSIKHVDKIMPFGDLVVVRANDDFRSAKTIEGVLVYLLGEVGWDLTRISNELAEFWAIADIHLADILQRLVDKKVLALSKPTFEAEPVWSLSIGFMEAVNERRSGKYTSAALASVEERGIGIKRDGGLRRGDLGMLSAPTAPNQSRMFRKQLETDAERGIGKRPVNPMSAEVSAQAEEKKQVPLADTELGKLDEKNSEAVDVEALPATDKKPYAVITRDRAWYQILDTSEKIDHNVLAKYLLAGLFDQAQSNRFNFAFAIFYGHTTVHDIVSAMVDELKIGCILDSGTTRRYLFELTNCGIIKLADGSEGDEFEFTEGFDVVIRAVSEDMSYVETEQLMSSSRNAETAHHEAYHAIVEDQFGNVSTAVVGEVESAKPEFTLEFMGTKQTVAAARETYDDVMAILSKAEDNSMLVKLFPPGAFENLKQYVEQFDELGTQF